MLNSTPQGCFRSHVNRIDVASWRAEAERSQPP